MAKNIGNKLIDSIGWLLFGIVLFIASIVVSFNVEGRINYKDVAVQSVAVEDAKDSKAFVYYEGDLTSSIRISDDLALYDGDYVVLDRNVEMYSWVEESKTEDEETLYKYENEWVNSPADSDKFNKSKNHTNPRKYIEDVNIKAPEVMVGVYTIDEEDVRYPGLKELKLNENVVDLELVKELNERYNKVTDDEDEVVEDDDDGWILGDDEEDDDSGWIVAGEDDEDEAEEDDREVPAKSNVTSEYVFIGEGTLNTPEVGDVRISYRYLPPMDEVVVFGRASDDTIKPHSAEASKKVYRVFGGVKEDALTKLQSEYETAGWMGRIGVFLLMWFGLMLLLKPLDVVLGMIPYLGDLGRGAINAITFVIALILTVVISFVLAVLNSTVGLILVGGLVVVGIYLYVNKPKAQKKLDSMPGHHPKKD